MKKNLYSKKYWDHNYSEPEEMDGISNAKEHARYCQSLFKLQALAVNTILDVGVGTGDLGLAFIQAFRPIHYLGIEPSQYIFKQAQQKLSRSKLSTQIRLKNMELSGLQGEAGSYDLGICNSVMQYLNEQEVKAGFKKLASLCHFVYFSVPTSRELSWQRSELEFHDKYAISRPKDFYLNCIRPHFRLVSFRLLQSKAYVDQSSHAFDDVLFRF